MESKSKADIQSHRLKRIILCAILALCSMASYAEPGATTARRSLSRHFIVLFDESVPQYRDCAASKIYSGVEQMLDTLGYGTEDDYLTLAGYSLNLDYPDFDKFIDIYTDDSGDAIKWSKVSNSDLASLIAWTPRQERWSGVEKRGSMQSLAKQYAMIAARPESNTLLADETYVLCITDDRINGGVSTYQQEWTSVLNNDNYKRFGELKDGVFAAMDQFKNWIAFDLLDINIEISSKQYQESYKVVAYRARPTREPAVGASVQIQTQVRRTRGGYVAGLLYPQENAHYVVRGIHFNDELAESQDLKVSDEVQWVRLSERSNDIDSLVVNVDVQMVDGFYNAFRFSGLHPNYPGMKVRQKMIMFDEPKVLGFFHLPNAMWWWSGDDIYLAVHLWDLIFVVIILIIVCYAFYKLFVHITTYEPDLEDIELKNL